MAPSDQGVYAWDAFRDRLIAEIAEGYERWLAALERLLLAEGHLGAAELERRTTEYLSGARDDDHDDHAH